MSKRKFTKEEEQQICNEYFSEEKPGVVILAKKWNCNHTTIGEIIRRNGYSLRTISEANKGHIPWNKNLTKEIDKRVLQLSKSLEGHVVEEKTKRKISKSNEGHKAWNKNIPLSEEHKRNKCIFTKEQEIEICNKYFSNEKPSVAVLAREWNSDGTTIFNLIKRNGYTPRTKSEARKGKIPANKNKPMLEKTKQILREKTLLQLQNSLGQFKDTKPELKMKEILNELNIQFEHQFRLKTHLFDFYLLNTNILIEVDGDYWHGNPKKFSTLYERQIKQKEKDLKNGQLAKENNFILIRFWEDDILNNVEKVKNKLMELYA